MFFTKRPVEIPSPENALPGRDYEIETAVNHFVLNTPIKGPVLKALVKLWFGRAAFGG